MHKQHLHNLSVTPALLSNNLQIIKNKDIYIFKRKMKQSRDETQCNTHHMTPEHFQATRAKNCNTLKTVIVRQVQPF